MDFSWHIGGVPQAYQPYNYAEGRERPQDHEYGRFFEEKLRAEQASRRKPLSKSLQQYQNVQNRPNNKREKALRARDLMNSPVRTIPQTASLAEAQRLMNEIKTHHLPVFDQHPPEKNIMIGILSDRDILKQDPKQNAKRRVQEIMTTKVLTAHPDANIHDVAGIMLDEKIHCLPLLEVDKTLTGILTTTDILKGLWKRAPLELWI